MTISNMMMTSNMRMTSNMKTTSKETKPNQNHQTEPTKPKHSNLQNQRYETKGTKTEKHNSGLSLAQLSPSLLFSLLLLLNTEWCSLYFDIQWPSKFIGYWCQDDILLFLSLRIVIKCI